jgi:Tol biopolymer transport system component
LPFTSLPGLKVQPAFSPDGNQVAFAWNADAGDSYSIYVKLVDAGSPLQITRSPGVDSSPAWSPDGRYIAFARQSSAGSGYYVVPALGGQERKLATSYSIPFSRGSSLDWSPDGKFLVAVDKTSPRDHLNILSISADSGRVHTLLTQPPVFLQNPAVSPDGSWLAYVAGRGFLSQDIFVIPVSGGEPRQLTADNANIGGLAWNSSGSQIIFSSNRGGLFALWTISLSGSEPQPVRAVGGDALSPTISRHGDHLAYLRMVVNSNIWKMSVGPSGGQAASPAKLISSTRNQWQPDFSPDGTRITFVSDRTGSQEIWVCDSNGANSAQLTSFRGPPTGTPRWSPDGQKIAFDSRAAGHSDIYVMNPDGGSLTKLTTEAAENVVPSWSRDGRWIYYTSDRTGQPQLWKIGIGGGQAAQVTKGGGREGVESADGQSLYYWKDNGIWKLPLKGGGEEQLVVNPVDWGDWSIGDRGIYILDNSATPSPAFGLFNFATGRMQRLHELEKWPHATLPPAFAVSRDERTFLFGRVDSIDNDIMLVDNFQ